MSSWARRQYAIHRPKITEEAVTAASHEFIQAVRRLNVHIREEPIKSAGVQ